MGSCPDTDIDPTFFNNPRREVLSSKTLKKNKKKPTRYLPKSLSVLNP